MTRPAIVQSTFDFAIREINALEGRIVRAEDDADEMLWEQARQVVAQLEGGLSLRKLAAQWINARTGKPYDKHHVTFVRFVWIDSGELTPRPRFRDCYNAIANAATAPPHVTHNSGEIEWHTPAEYVDAARRVMDGIDLDPASSEQANEIVKADRIFTAETDGLKQAWSGRVWMNPPYAPALVQEFTAKLVQHVVSHEIEAAIVLVNNATETQWFRTMADVADAICFKTGRIQFRRHGDTAASGLQGQVFLYFGTEQEKFIQEFGRFGIVMIRAQYEPLRFTDDRER